MQKSAIFANSKISKQNMSYEEIELKELDDIIKSGVALIVTVTEIETNATHQKLKPIQGYSNILQVYDETNTYYFGVFGKYNIVHVQSNMGSIGRDSAILTISNAVKALKPKFVIMIGIAFGVDETKQKIGDVLVSEGITPYDNKRVGEETIQRGQNAPCSKLLLNRIKAVRTWEHFLNKKDIAKSIFTQILSGEELVDNKERRDELVKAFPNSKGGEMEGAGLFAACDGEVDWILVKGICDFADGNKGKNKKENQSIAINSALSLCIELFNSKHAFDFLGLSSITNHQPQICSCNHEQAEEVLFEVYNRAYEQYYIEREADELFTNILEQYCIWVHGISGCGKTNLILRNLEIKDVNYLPISLVSCIEPNVVDLFIEILFDLETKFGKVPAPLENISFSNVCRNILSLLEHYCTDKDYVLFIEEIPISSEEDYKEFVSHFFSLLILKKLKHGLNKIKFVLSSIKDPTSHIQQNHLKIHQQVKFMEIENWIDDDIDKLIPLLCNVLCIKLDSDFINKLKSTSSNSPRFIKKFFRNVLACCVSDEIDYGYILAETERELKQYYHG